MAKKARRPDLQKVIEDAFNSDDPRGMVIARGFAARALNVDPSEIPEELDTPAKLNAWVTSLIACAGGIDHTREVYDRLAPKPKRVEVSGPGGGPIRTAVSPADDPTGRKAAESYLNEIALGAAAGAVLAAEVADDEEDCKALLGE